MKQLLKGFPLDFLAGLAKGGSTIGIDGALRFPQISHHIASDAGSPPFQY